jgi:putative ABC transport system substrate-binding protein
MRRRSFIAGGLSGLAMWPRAARGERRIPVIGFLSSVHPPDYMVDSFRRGLFEAGYVAGTGVKIEYRDANGEYGQLQSLAAELTGLPVDVIVAVPSSPAALAAKAVTSTIPIVFSMGVDPVRLGLVQSYNKPGGNLTGVVVLANELTPKRIELLNQLIPSSVPIAELVNPANPTALEELRASDQTVRALGREFIPVRASNKDEIEAAFVTVRDSKAALVVWFEAYFTAERALIVSLAKRHSVITIYGTRIFTEIGGLISYGSNIPAMYRLLGGYTGKILDGALPANLPVMQPTKLELVINLKAAQALGLNIPSSLLATADEVIE